MKTKLFLAVVMLALLALSTVPVFAESQSNAQLTPFEVLANSIINPMATCNYYCSWCLGLGRGGACSASLKCC